VTNWRQNETLPIMLPADNSKAYFRLKESVIEWNVKRDCTGQRSYVNTSFIDAMDGEN
jgi:hypothetical protein